MTRIVLDAMGGDLAPQATVAGAVDAAREGITVVLVGVEEQVRAELARVEGPTPNIEVVHAPEVVAMGDHDARTALRRRDTSIAVGIDLIRDGAGDAFISAGNTGAGLAVSLVRLGRLPGIERPAIGILLPMPSGVLLLLDGGANADARASHLLQWAVLGSSYMRTTRGLAEPEVALLNIGEEATKGSQVTVEAHGLLAASGLNFIGNVEGRDLPWRPADVVVTDGFTGNTVLKFAEGLSSMMFEELREAASQSLRARIGGLLIRPEARRMRDRLDYRIYGAAPLLGLQGTVYIGHGPSDARAIANAIRTADGAASAGIVDALRAAAAESEQAAS